ncbi:immunoglobulin-like domain-containing protein [Pontibacter pudoricolor]|uniref:immunoglobulin-like domain-containing protein n=1 Tax=Pontibacter pudoricolor TaxID=2694930 RepID=UPI0013913169|nr:immunoglobulin-like domain-containing protein [Pontibacter pudoricolor]
MKKNKILFVIALLLTGSLMSCEKDTEDISRITFYPDFVIGGEEVMTLVQGEEFVDPGVTASANEVELDVTTSIVGSPFIVPGQTQPEDVTYTNSLDTNVPGLYIITYSAVNEDGFTGTTQRVVVVLDQPADPNVDLTGTYSSTAPSPNATITKLADGVFFSSNVWGGVVRLLFRLM